MQNVKATKFLSQKEWLFMEYVGNQRTTIDIAKELGCGDSLVGVWLRKHNIKARNPRLAQTKNIKSDDFCNKDWLYQHYCVEGMSAAEIAERLGISNVSVLKLLKTFDIPKRSLSQARNQLRAKGRITGANHPNWKGGITPLNHLVRNTTHYKQWRKTVLIRDSKQCVECGVSSKVDVHHLMKFSDLMRRFCVQTLSEALECQELWNIENGKTLCKKCHATAHKKVP